MFAVVDDNVLKNIISFQTVHALVNVLLNIVELVVNISNIPDKLLINCHYLLHKFVLHCDQTVLKLFYQNLPALNHLLSYLSFTVLSVSFDINQIVFDFLDQTIQFEVRLLDVRDNSVDSE